MHYLKFSHLFFYDIADLTLCGLCTITYIVHVDGYDTRGTILGKTNVIMFLKGF